jgi:hypothetical protein
MAGKGSKPRPFSVDTKTFDSNWDNIFRKQKEQAVINEVSKLIAEETLDETENRITDHSQEGQ